MPQTIDWPELAKASPALQVLPPEVRAAARLVTVPRSGRVFMQGDRPRAMFFVVAGEVHLVRRSSHGMEVVLQRARGGFLAEASLDQDAYHCDAAAVAPTELLSVPRQVFSDALADREFRMQWIGHLTRELRRVRAQTERMTLRSAADRIIHYIATEGDGNTIRLAHSKKAWANELGLTHEALYRTLARMQKVRQIAIDGDTIRLLTFIEGRQSSI